MGVEGGRGREKESLLKEDEMSTTGDSNASKELRNEEDVLAAVVENGLALEDVPEKFKDDEDNAVHNFKNLLR
ncbi:MAG: DUF4116 domain-containing protein [Candidatus Kuenenbacteria bacterium]